MEDSNGSFRDVMDKLTSIDSMIQTHESIEQGSPVSKEECDILLALRDDDDDDLLNDQLKMTSIPLNHEQYYNFVNRERIWNSITMSFVNDEDILPNQLRALVPVKKMKRTRPINQRRKRKYKDEFVEFSLMMHKIYEDGYVMVPESFINPEIRNLKKKFVEVSLSNCLDDVGRQFPRGWILFNIRLTKKQKDMLVASNNERFIFNLV